MNGVYMYKKVKLKQPSAYEVYVLKIDFFFFGGGGLKLYLLLWRERGPLLVTLLNDNIENFPFGNIASIWKR